MRISQLDEMNIALYLAVRYHDSITYTCTLYRHPLALFVLSPYLSPQPHQSSLPFPGPAHLPPFPGPCLSLLPRFFVPSRSSTTARPPEMRSQHTPAVLSGHTRPPNPGILTTRVRALAGLGLGSARRCRYRLALQIIFFCEKL